MEVAALSLRAKVPVCWRAFRPSLGGLLEAVGCWVHRGCLAVLVPVAVGAVGPGATVPAGLRGLYRGPVGFSLRGLVGGGLPPRRRGCTVAARALAVAAAASSTARSTVRSLHLVAAAAASAAACMAAASALSAELCRRVGLSMTAGSVPTVAKEPAALARWSPPRSLPVRVGRLTSEILLFTA